MSFLELLKPYWHLVCRAQSLKRKPYAFTLLGTPLVLFRTEGKVAVLLDQCPHRSVPLSQGRLRGENIECSYHGWQFDAQGFCQRIPGLCRKIPYEESLVRNFPVVEKAGFIWVALTSPNSLVPYVSEYWNHPKMNSFFWFTTLNATVANAVENFLDGTHTHFVHRGILRRDKNRQRIEAIVRPKIQGIEVEYTEEGKQNGLISRLFEKERGVSFGRFLMPSIAEIEYRSTQSTTFISTLYFTPISEMRLNVCALVSVPKGKIPRFLQQWILTPFFLMVLKQDKHILEMQQKHLERFSDEQGISTELDLVGPLLRQLLQGKDISELAKKEYRVSLEL